MDRSPEAAVVEVPAGSASAMALAALHARAFDRPWSAEDIAASLHEPGGLALQVGAGPHGFILLRIVFDEAEVLALAVEPAARRAGLGRALVQGAMERARADGAETIWLEAADDNAAAQSLYFALGFAEVGRRRGYYPRPGGAADALVLRRRLNTP